MCRRYTTYKTVVILQLVKLGYMFRPLRGHRQVNKEILLRYILLPLILVRSQIKSRLGGETGKST
jgi:hypothetical protein